MMKLKHEGYRDRWQQKRVTKKDIFVLGRRRRREEWGMKRKEMNDSLFSVS